MRRHWCAPVFVLAVCVDAGAQTPAPVAPVARATLEPSGPVTIGQAVLLHVDVFVPTFFMQPPSLPPIAVERAEATLQDGALNMNDRVDGEVWSGIRRDYRVVAQSPGRIQIPPVPVVVRYGVNGRLSDPFTVQTPALSFEARIPPGAEGLDYFFAAPRLQLTERFDRRPSTVRVGDAFTRLVTVTAADATAIALPPVPLDAPDGVRLQADPPQLASQRGERGGASTVSRSERVTYTVTRPGHFVLPAIEVRYWNTADSQIRRVSLPAVPFDVSDQAAFGEEIALPPEAVEAAPASPMWQRWLERWWRVLLTGAVLLVVALWLARLLLPRAVASWRAARAARVESESHYFGLVKYAARRGDLRGLHAAALAWLPRLPGLDVRTLSGLAAQADDAQLAADVAALGQALYARDATASRDDALAARVFSGLARARHRLAAPPRLERQALRPLNPW